MSPAPDTQPTGTTSELLTIAESAALVGLSRRSIYRLLGRDSGFPRPVRPPGINAPRFRRSELDAWVAALAA